MEEIKQTENIDIQPEETTISSPEISEIKPKKSQSLLIESMAFKFMLVFGVVFMSFVFVFQIWLTPIKVIGSSMQPTINLRVLSNSDEQHCDIVYFNKDNAYQSDDIVIVSNQKQNYITDPDVQYLIKRVVACPGDTITFYLTSVK